MPIGNMTFCDKDAKISVAKYIEIKCFYSDI